MSTSYSGHDDFGAFHLTDDHPPANPRISVVMGVHNGQDSVDAAVCSIFQQTWSDFEFLVVDDGSTDATAERLAALARTDRRLRIVRNDRNIGLTKSLIRGIGLSRGMIIARQDADDISLPHRFATQMAFFPRYDLVCSRTLINGERPLPKWPSAVLFRLVLLSHNVFVHGSFMFTRDMYDRINGYDPAFDYAQDYDFIARACTAGCRIRFLKRILYHSRKDATCISRQRLERQTRFAHIVRQRLQRHSGILGVFYKEVLSTAEQFEPGAGRPQSFVRNVEEKNR